MHAGFSTNWLNLKYYCVGWDSAGGLSIALLSATTTPSSIIFAFTPFSITCNFPPPFSHAKVSTYCFCAWDTCEPGRRGSSLDKSPIICWQNCQTLSPMIAWMTFCPSPPSVSFESGHAKLGLTQPFLSSTIGHCWEQRLITPIFVTSPCHSRLPITTSPIQIRKVTWNYFICELQLFIIHLVPKTNPITSQIID